MLRTIVIALALNVASYEIASAESACTTGLAGFSPANAEKPSLSRAERLPQGH
jgi:hypothetical protein